MKKEELSNVSGSLFDLKMIRKLYVFIKPYLFQFYFLVFLTILGAALSTINPMLIRKAIDGYLMKGDMDGFYLMIAGMFGVLFVTAIFQYTETYLSSWLGQTIIRNIRIRLYNHLLKFRLSFFDKTPIGRLVTRNISDIESISNVFSEGLAGIVGDLLQLIFILGFLLYINWKLTLVSIAALPILLIGTYIFKEKVKHSFNLVRLAVSNLNTFVQEHISGMSIVQIFNSEKREYEKFKEINKEHRNANLKSVLYYSVYFPLAEIIASVCIALMLWYGTGSMLNMETSFGDIVAFNMFIGMFFRPIRMIADRFNTIQMAVVSSDRIFKLLDDEEEIPANGMQHPSHMQGAIEFDHVWFAYQNEEHVLKDISFKVKPGETIAFVGATGSGKTTIINLLNRFYDINKGSIAIDGINLKEYDAAFLRNNIGMVLQDVFLFSDSIRNNITLNNPEISDEKIWNAIDLVGARRFIENLPGGLSYNVMERGATLSVGQRQLISFIRCLVYDPAIIILDEATSSIDSETEELIQNAIEKLMKGRTSVVIAHRLSTIQKANTILVMEKGEIKESGTHQQLLDQNGIYAQLSKLQYKHAG